MRAKEFIIENKETYQPPSIDIGDEVRVGKFKNRKAQVKGFKTDKNNQPVLKTTKGDQQLFKPRITKLMKESAIDILEEQCRDLQIHLLKNPDLYENTENFNYVHSFLQQQENIEPVIGKLYSPVSILTVPPGKIINIKHFSELAPLVEHQDYLFYFTFNGEMYRFPDGERVSGDQLSNTILFRTVEDKNQFLTILRLKFSEWSITEKTIE